MEWIKEIVETNNNIEYHEDEEFKSKLQTINNNLAETMYEHIENERLSEQYTLQLSKEYILG